MSIAGRQRINWRAVATIRMLPVTNSKQNNHPLETAKLVAGFPLRRTAA